jgi:hypothetical protein
MMGAAEILLLNQMIEQQRQQAADRTRTVLIRSGVARPADFRASTCQAIQHLAASTCAPHPVYEVDYIYPVTSTSKCAYCSTPHASQNCPNCGAPGGCR